MDLKDREILLANTFVKMFLDQNLERRLRSSYIENSSSIRVAMGKMSASSLHMLPYYMNINNAYNISDKIVSALRQETGSSKMMDYNLFMYVKSIAYLQVAEVIKKSDKYTINEANFKKAIYCIKEFNFSTVREVFHRAGFPAKKMMKIASRRVLDSKKSIFNKIINGLVEAGVNID